jgi:hypothetical protein
MEKEMDMLPEINECSKGLLFTKLWEERGITLKRQKNRKLTIQEVLQEVWVSTADKWRSICQKLKIGALLFTEFDDYFGKTETGNLLFVYICIDVGYPVEGRVGMPLTGSLMFVYICIDVGDPVEGRC